MELFGANLRLLTEGMAAALTRQRVAAQNLANADTPGYKASRVLFEGKLRQALAQDDLAGLTADARHLPIGAAAATAVPTATVVTDTASAGRTDGNGVDLEVESATMAANEIWYAAMARLTSDELHRLRLAVSGGK